MKLRKTHHSHLRKTASSFLESAFLSPFELQFGPKSCAAHEIVTRPSIFLLSGRYLFILVFCCQPGTKLALGDEGTLFGAATAVVRPAPIGSVIETLRDSR